MAQPIFRGRQRRAGENCADASRWLRHYVRLRSTIGRNVEFIVIETHEVQGAAFAYASIELPQPLHNLHFLATPRGGLSLALVKRVRRSKHLYMGI